MITGTDIMKGHGKKVVRFTVGLLTLLIVAGSPGVGAGQVLNPSFESTFSAGGLLRPLNWVRWGDPSSFEASSTNSWKTDGAQSAALVSRPYWTFTPGVYRSFLQYVDLTGVDRIAFDVALLAPAGGFASFEASLLVNDVVLWSSTTAGIYLNQQVSLAGLPDDWPFSYDLIELRLTAVEGGAFDAVYSAFWDNIRCLEGLLWLPAAIDLEPGTLNLASNGRWVTCYIELEEDGAVALIDGATVTLDGIPAEVAEHGWAARWANEDNITDHDGDGIPERMVRFSREAVQAIVEAPQTTVTIQGCLLDGTPFEGTAVLRVLDKNAKK